MRWLVMALAVVLSMGTEARAGSLSTHDFLRECQLTGLVTPGPRSANCQAFFSAPVDVMQAQGNYLTRTCRKTPLDGSDLGKFALFVRDDDKLQNAPASVSLFKFWLMGPVPPPCAEAGGFWSADYLQKLCRQDYGIQSACKFYTSSALEFAQVLATLKSQTLMCPGGKARDDHYIVSDDEVMKSFDAFLEKHPDERSSAAGDVFVHALMAANPCTK